MIHNTAANGGITPQKKRFASHSCSQDFVGAKGEHLHLILMIILTRYLKNMDKYHACPTPSFPYYKYTISNLSTLLTPYYGKPLEHFFNIYVKLNFHALLRSLSSRLKHFSTLVERQGLSCNSRLFVLGNRTTLTY